MVSFVNVCHLLLIRIRHPAALVEVEAVANAGEAVLLVVLITAIEAFRARKLEILALDYLGIEVAAHLA